MVPLCYPRERSLHGVPRPSLMAPHLPPKLSQPTSPARPSLSLLPFNPSHSLRSFSPIYLFHLSFHGTSLSLHPPAPNGRRSEPFSRARWEFSLHQETQSSLGLLPFPILLSAKIKRLNLKVKVVLSATLKPGVEKKQTNAATI